MYQVKTPSVLKPLAKDLLWHVDSCDNTLYLTFDDGPTPKVTDEVLRRLARYNAKATFFCLAKNVESHTTLYNEILSQGHLIGNHTFDHVDGWKTANFTYYRSVLKAASVFNSKLFRPPYGRITPAQVGALKQRFTIVMWDVLSADFDPETTPEQCLKNVIENAVSGSIVVFHDSVKAHKKMLYALEGALDHFSKKNFQFCSLPI